jgi:hypothetical protein
MSSVLQAALSGLAWFLAVVWLDFSYGLKMHVTTSVVIGGSVMSLTLLLLTLSGRLVHGCVAQNGAIDSED